jgi:cobalt/nickel transport system permease protein
VAHIPDGVLSAPVLLAGATATAGLLAVALRRLDYERIPQAAVLAAGFFVASLVTVPVGPSSVHLMLTGLMGVLLGWTAVPTVLVALVLQALFFGYGGVLVLGNNTFNIALPALLCAWLVRPWVARAGPGGRLWAGAVAGGGAVLASGALVAGSLAASGEAFVPAAQVILLTYLPLAAVEGVITATVLAFLGRVAPEYLPRTATSPH